MSTETRTCENPGCDERFAAKNPRRRFCSDDCRFEAWDTAHPRLDLSDRTTVDTPDLDEVRAQHEESKGHWTVIVREHLNRTLLETGFVSALDFDALGVPPEHVNLANAQMGAYSRAGFMEPVTWQRSKKASRKSGKIWTFRITEKGRDKLTSTLAGAGAGGGKEPKGTPSRDPLTVGGTSASPGERTTEDSAGPRSTSRVAGDVDGASSEPFPAGSEEARPTLFGEAA